MPETLLSPPPPGEISAGLAVALESAELDETFLVSRDAEIAQLLIEKPAACVLNITLESALDQGSGISILLVALTAADDVTTALRASGVLLQRRGRGRLLVQTSGATSGTKKVCVLLRPLP